ncbi:MAG: hypothetical protein NVSMB17_04900 [Candidatus Dormibacteria bacterium]
MAEGGGRYVCIVLFRGEPGAAVAEALRAALLPFDALEVGIGLPALRGVDFLSASGTEARLADAWWARTVPAGTTPVFLAMDEDGLKDWIPGTGGRWYVGVQDHTHASEFRALTEPVAAVVTTDAREVAARALEDLGAGGGPGRADQGLGPRPTQLTRPAGPARPITYEPEPPATTPVLFDRLPPNPAPPPGDQGLRLSHPARFARAMDWRSLPDRLGRVIHADIGRPPSPSPRLGRLINAHRPIVVAFASRKGGVGKTTLAAAVGATVGEALDGSPDTAALVDGNVTNPDAWALHPPPGSATVRTLVSRLALGQDPPAERYARTPRLAIYPESRVSEEVYTQAEIDMVAEYLRRRHSFIALDLPNALPSLTSGGPGAVAAAWLTHADVVVLPFNADPRARQGLLEYVDALQDGDLGGVPIVAPYVLSSKRAIADDAAVQADLELVARRGVTVVHIPDDENALLALLRDLPINRASPRLRRAFVALTDCVVAVAIAARQPA